MKKVNFEAGERVDAPDANALSEVVHEELNRLMSLILLESGLKNNSSSDSYQANAVNVDGLIPVSLGEHIPVRTFLSTEQAYAIQVGPMPSSSLKGGVITGDATEEPLVDLSHLADEVAGTVNWLCARVIFKAGKKENRARWRSDLNPPREEVYRANTRKVPVFDARMFSTATLPTPEDGWFKIAKVTRTTSSDNDLRRFRFEDQRLLLLEGGFPSQYDVANSTGSDAFYSETADPSVGIYGDGITQNIQNSAVRIAYSVDSRKTVILPSAVDETAKQAYSALFALFESSARSGYYDSPEIMRSAVVALSKLKSNVAGAEVVDSVDSLGDFVREVARLISEVRFGSDNIPSLASRGTYASEKPLSNRALSWRRGSSVSGNNSLATANAQAILSATIDSASNEALPEALFNHDVGLSSLLFMATCIIRPLYNENQFLRHSQSAKFVGFARSGHTSMTDNFFGGGKFSKEESNYRKNGGLLVRGGHINETQGAEIIPCIENIIGTAQRGDLPDGNFSNYVIDGNGAVVRKHSSGVVFPWVSASAERSNVSLTVENLNFTDLSSFFSVEQFIEDNPLATRLEYTTADGQFNLDGGMIHIAEGGLTFNGCTFITFHGGDGSYSDSGDVRARDLHSDMIRSKSTTLTDYFLNIAISQGAFSEVVRFSDCTFLRQSRRADNNTPQGAMIRTNIGDGGVESADSAVVFDGCTFADFDFDPNSREIRYITDNPTTSPMIKLEGASNRVSFVDCSFNSGTGADNVLMRSSMTNCRFSNSNRPIASTRSVHSSPTGIALYLLPLADGAVLIENDAENDLGSSFSSVGTSHSVTSLSERMSLIPRGDSAQADGPHFAIAEAFTVGPKDTLSDGEQFSEFSTHAELPDYTRKHHALSNLPMFSKVTFNGTQRRFNALFDDLHLIRFRRGSNSDFALSANDAENTDSNKAILSARSFLKESGTLTHTPTLIDEVSSYGSSLAENRSIYLSHVDMSQTMKDLITIHDTDAPRIVSEARAPSTLKGNVKSPTFGFDIPDVYDASIQRAKRGWLSERPDEPSSKNVPSNPPNFEALTGLPVAYNNGVAIPTPFEYQINTQQNNNSLAVDSFEGSVFQSSAVLLGTPSDQADCGERLSFDGVNRRTVTHLRVSGAITFSHGSGADLFFARFALGSGDTYFSGMRFGIAHRVGSRYGSPFQSDNSGNQKTALLLNDAFDDDSGVLGISLLDDGFKSPIGLDAVSENVVASNIGRNLFTHRAKYGSPCLMTRRDGDLKSEGIGEMLSLISSSARVRIGRVTEPTEVLSTRLELIPIGFRSATSFVFRYTHILVGGGEISGLVKHDTAHAPTYTTNELIKGGANVNVSDLTSDHGSTQIEFSLDFALNSL